MSALSRSNLQPVRPAHLQLVDAIRGRHPNPGAVVVSQLVAGAAIILGLYMLLFVLMTSSQYQLADLKAQHAKVLEDTQILKQQVDSLSSNQNLSDAAQVLGMVSNANPVFLSVANQEVYGVPKAALAQTSGRVSGNLVGNSAMSARTSAAELRAAVAAQEKAATRTVKTMQPTKANNSSTKQTASSGNQLSAAGSNVATGNSGSSQVGSLGGQIPTSPTH